MVKIQIGEDLEERPCFSPDGFRYAASLVRSRACIVDGALRLLPYLDYINHANFKAYEIRDVSVGRFGISDKGTLLKSGKRLPRGAEFLVSYGPKGPADYGDGGGDESEPKSLCAMVQGAERKALERTLAFAKQEAEALDLKEYYQERRLKSLAL